jgi:hypothetical protein
MGAPALEVGYTSATTGSGDHEVHKGHVVELERKQIAVSRVTLTTLTLTYQLTSLLNENLFHLY